MIASNSHNPNLPCIIDLFSGCGGMSHGFSNAGFPVLASVDINKSAVKTAEYNLAHRSGISDFGHKGITADIRELRIEDILPEGFDSQLIVIGGPPCQAYSMAGRGKLRSLGEHRAHTKDERGNFYIDFLNFAISAKACAVVMENVPAAVSYGENVPDDACNLLEKNGYHAKWTILNAADFGVPQRRERLFLIATRKDSKMNPAFPRASHKCPKGQITQTGRMLKGLQERSDHFVLPAPNKSKKALGDRRRSLVRPADSFSFFRRFLLPAQALGGQKLLISTYEQLPEDYAREQNHVLRPWFQENSSGFPRIRENVRRRRLQACCGNCRKPTQRQAERRENQRKE